MGEANNLAHFLMTYDFETKQYDFARYLPALQDVFIKVASGHGIHQNRSLNPTFYDFFQTSGSAFHYPMALYSAGVGMPGDPLSQKDKEMVYLRDKTKTYIITDSGGYQITKGLDFINFRNPDHVEEMTEKTLKWQLATGNRGAIIDVPPDAIVPHDKAWPFRCIGHCLEQTKKNINAYLELGIGNHPFLNVVQGTETESAIDWYEAVKEYPLQGWAFGSNVKSNYHALLTILIKLRDEQRLDPTKQQDWLHMFGMGRIREALHYTQIKRCLQVDIPTLQITFDTASYSIEGSRYGTMYFKHIEDDLNKKQPEVKAIRSPRGVRGPMLPNKNDDREALTELGERAKKRLMAMIDTDPTTGEKIEYFEDTLSPIVEGFVPDDFIVPWAMKSDKGWDNVSIANIGLHNLFVNLKAINDANFEFSVGNFYQLPGKGKDFAGGNLHEKYEAVKGMNDLIVKIFGSTDPHSLLDEHQVFLEKY